MYSSNEKNLIQVINMFRRKKNSHKEVISQATLYLEKMIYFSISHLSKNKDIVPSIYLCVLSLLVLEVSNSGIS